MVKISIKFNKKKCLSPCIHCFRKHDVGVVNDNAADTVSSCIHDTDYADTGGETCMAFH